MAEVLGAAALILAAAGASKRAGPLLAGRLASIHRDATMA
jgi:hypothetical protein